MRARAALFRQVREFLETQAVGLYGVRDVAYFVARPAEDKREGGRRFAFGREREIVEGKFGEFEIVLESPNEVPPLGRLTLRWPGGEVDGPIDRMTFERAGAAIRGRAINRQTERTTAS